MSMGFQFREPIRERTLAALWITVLARPLMRHVKYCAAKLLSLPGGRLAQPEVG